MPLLAQPQGMTDWQDHIVGARMTVDQEFADRVAESQFSRQQWGLIMTAVEFDLEHPGDPDRARIVADTSKLPHIMEELDTVERQAAAMQAGRDPGEGGGGLFDSVKSALGLGGDDGPDEDLRRAAESLAQEYASELQAHLEAEDRWETVRTAAAE
jgi:hypothetical protein